MSDQEEKQARYFFGLKPQEDTIRGHATRKAEDQCQYMLPALDAMLQKNAKLRLLDVGCGPGSITIGFAKRMPEGEVVGLDLSEAVLERAKAEAEKQGVANVKCIKGDVYHLPFEDGKFDVVHGHQAMGHFHDHVAALKEMIRVTKKGGMICLRDGDIPTHRIFPEYKVLDEFWETVVAVGKANGGTVDGGLRLKHWAVQAGVPRENITATASAWCYNTPEGRQSYGGTWPGRCTEGGFAETAMKCGAATRERLQEYAEAWRQWTADEDGMFTMTHGEIIVRV